MELKIEYLDKSQLKPYANNAKIHTAEQVEQIKNSIREFGFNDPIAVWGDNEIVEGHGRLLAVMEMDQFDQVPVIRLDQLSDEQRRAYMLAHNKLTMNTDFDIDLLNLELDDIVDIDMEQFGFDVSVDDDPENVIEDEVPEEVETRCKLGDLWQLGNHRLICGNSTDTAVIDRLMEGEKADMVFTDPPYNVNYSNADRPKPSKKDLGKIKNDRMSDDEFMEFLTQIYKRLDENTKDDSSFYIWYADKTTIQFYLALKETNIDFNQMLIWKKPMLLGRSKYQFAHEPCIFATKGKPYFTDDRTKTTVWDFGGYDKSNNVHPTQKPLFLPTEAINNSSNDGDLVLDVFGGSGSTLIACEQLNRKCYMAELDPRYCDVIIQRWENFTGEKAVLLNGE